MESSTQIAQAVSARQFRAARALLGWTLEDAASYCGVGRATMSRLERGESQLIERTVHDIVRGFERHGIRFFDNESGQGVAIRSVE